MQRLSDRLRRWAEAQATNPDLQGVTIVISCDRDPGRARWGAGTPGMHIECCCAGSRGEGEHKIMNVIRNHPEHTHCLCSNDAVSWLSIAPAVYVDMMLCDLRIWSFWVWCADLSMSICCARNPTMRRKFAPSPLLRSW